MAMWSCQRSTYPQFRRLQLRVELVLTVQSKTPWCPSFGRATETSHTGWKRKTGKMEKGVPRPSWASNSSRRGCRLAVASELTDPATPACAGGKVEKESRDPRGPRALSDRRVCPTVVLSELTDPVVPDRQRPVMSSCT